MFYGLYFAYIYSIYILDGGFDCAYHSEFGFTKV